MGDAERPMPMAHRPMPMLHEPRPMAQGPMPERAKPSRSPSWPDDGLSTSDGSDVIDYGIGRGDDDSCSKGDIRDGNSVDRCISDSNGTCPRSRPKKYSMLLLLSVLKYWE